MSGFVIPLRRGRQRSDVGQELSAEGAAAMPDDEATISGQPASLSGELIALPSLERGIPSLEGHDRGGLGLGLGGGTDSVDGAAGARQKALEVVQTAVELADRIETQARESASERLRRADE